MLCFSQWKRTNWFSARSGVRQGHVAVPDLFNCIIDQFMMCVYQQISRAQLGSYYLTDLECVQDTTLFSNTATDHVARFYIFDEKASKLSLEVSWEETEVMYVGDIPYPLPITISSVVVEFASSVNYLGSIIMNTGDLLRRLTNAEVLLEA